MLLLCFVVDEKKRDAISAVFTTEIHTAHEHDNSTNEP